MTFKHDGFRALAPRAYPAVAASWLTALIKSGEFEVSWHLLPYSSPVRFGGNGGSCETTHPSSDWQGAGRRQVAALHRRKIWAMV